jgi:hypothetical protein
MDIQRFDDLARVLAGGLPRRAALRTLLGAASAGIATRAITNVAALPSA